MKKAILALALAIAAACPAWASVENDNHDMAGGTFGVAWLDATGELRVFDGQKVTRFMEFYQKGTQIAAVDVDGDGRDELAVVGWFKKDLYIIDVDKTVQTGKTTYAVNSTGDHILYLTAGRDANGLGQVLINNTLNRVFLWKQTNGKGGWTNVPGDFSQASAGKLQPNSAFDSFVTVTDGDVYLFNPVWNMYTQKALGKSIRSTICGNFAPATKEDEIVIAGKENTWILIGKKVDPLDKVVKSMSVGKTPEKDVLIAVAADGALWRYDRTDKSWTALAQNVTGFTCVVTAPAADGGYTIYAQTEDGLYRVSPDGKTAELVAGQATSRIPLKSGGKTVAVYQKDGKCKPFIEKLYTPAGVQVLRDSSPLRPHHHSLMFAHKADQTEFWGEYGPNCGFEIPVKLESTESSIKSELNWIRPDGEVLLKEHREITVEYVPGADGGQPQCVLTWKTVLTPAGDKPVLLNGHNAYFGLGLRFVADLDTGARFFNSTGVHDGKIVRDDERVKPCQWFGITGKVEGKPITLIIYDQPGNTRPMTGYTMGDAGKTSAYMSATMATREKPIELKPGESLTACYKIVVTDEEHE